MIRRNEHAIMGAVIGVLIALFLIGATWIPIHLYTPSPETMRRFFTPVLVVFMFAVWGAKIGRELDK